MIVIVDTGGANLASLRYAFVRLNQKAKVSQDPNEIQNAKAVILPGVGHASHVMKKIETLGLIKIIQNLAQPVLGICLGMQILFEESEESIDKMNTPGLGILPGKVIALKPSKCTTVPHMGWNKVKSITHNALLDSPTEFYFVHSYFISETAHTVSVCSYGENKISAIVNKNNFWGTQFHPERSGLSGSLLLKQFIKAAL